jgi:hypothetical protein
MTQLKHRRDMTNLEKYTFWRTNLIEAQKFWAIVNPDNVDLSDWRDPDGCEDTPDYATAPSCGTLCCFGGWLPWSPYFAALGVSVSESRGWPVIDEASRDGEYGGGVARYLFGAYELFDSAESREIASYGSDYDIVAARLAKRLAEVNDTLAGLE